MFIYKKEKKSREKLKGRENMKKILNFMFVLAILFLVQIVPNVSAEETTVPTNGVNDNSGTITITDAIEGKEYNAYQILVLESYDTTKNAYTYKVANGWVDFFDSKTDGEGAEYVTIDTAGVVTWVEGKDTANDMKEFAQAALRYATSKNISATQTQTAAPDADEDTTTTVTFSGLNLGYYLVDSSVGALCSLTTTKPTAEAEEKNSVPTIDKTVNNGGTYKNSNTASIGDTVNFKTVINIGDGAQSYVLYDTMSTGLTLKSDTIKVYLNGEETSNLISGTDKFEITYPDGYTFVITFNNTYTATLDSSDQIIVKYDALLNENAVIAGSGNTNEALLEYGDSTDTTNKTTPDTTITYTYEFDLVKTDSTYTLLDGAEFRLYDASTGGNEIAVVFVSEGVYRVAKDGETGVVIDVKDGKVTIRGLANGTYYLEETTAPDGYNKLTERKAITIADANNNSTITALPEADSEGHVNTITGGLHVVNLTGAEMPTTGGIGTMLFVTIGSIMVLGFGVLLVTKLRISKMSA